MFPDLTLSFSFAVQNYYSSVPACRCKEHEIRHICRYHGRTDGDEGPEAAGPQTNAASGVSSQPKTCPHCMRKASKDIYIEVSPGTYSITATSEDMVKQTHVVDVSAGQSVDLTFVL
ncbi:A-kinase-interacting protein 1 [Nothoprocta perdicaria]|uniref:A-kinase-interacting protein 1 n=1 Tax=Nothoprocta perdicaria TaxID=30464 RepID=UPI000E1B6BFE|nr:A-kinase-interacting protein 1 [Nothoprocta perdicaria]